MKRWLFLGMLFTPSMVLAVANNKTVKFSGFETGDTSELAGSSAVSGTVAIITTNTHAGSYACETYTTLATGTANITLEGYNTGGGTTIVSTWPVACFSFYWKPMTIPASLNEQFAVVTDTTPINKFSARINSAGNIVAYDTNDATLATGTTVISTGKYYQIDIKVSTGLITAAWEIRVNGKSEISGAGNLSSGNIGSLKLGKSGNKNGQAVDYVYDDVIWATGTYVGAQQTFVLNTSTNGTNQGGASTGVCVHWTCTNQLPPDGATTYMAEVGAVGCCLETEYVSSGSVVVSGIINAVEAAIDNAGSGSFQEDFISGATSKTGATQADATTFQIYGLIQDIDPATGLNWTINGTNLLQAGCNNQNNSGVATQMTSVYVMVNFTTVINNKTQLYNGKLYNGILR